MVEASNLQVMYNKHFDEVHGRLDDIHKELGAVQLSIGSLRRRDVGVFTNSLCEHSERDLQDMNSCKTDLIGDSMNSHFGWIWLTNNLDVLTDSTIFLRDWNNQS